MKNRPPIPAQLRAALKKTLSQAEELGVGEFLEQCRGWQNSDLGQDFLVSNCARLASYLREVSQQTKVDLETVDSSSEIFTCLETIVSGSREIADILESLPQLAVEENWEVFRERRDVAVGERELVLEARDYFRIYFDPTVKVCRACGAEEESVCPDCGLTTLFEAPLDCELEGTEPGELPLSVSQTRETLFDILDGMQSIEALPPRLMELESYLDQLEEIAEQFEQQRSVAVMTRAALEKLCLAYDSLKSEELILGWNQLHRATKLLLSELDSEGHDEGWPGQTTDRVELSERVG